MSNKPEQEETESRTRDIGEIVSIRGSKYINKILGVVIIGMLYNPMHDFVTGILPARGEEAKQAVNAHNDRDNAHIIQQLDVVVAMKTTLDQVTVQLEELKHDQDKLEKRLDLLDERLDLLPHPSAGR
jgi:hypothetical protein